MKVKLEIALILLHVIIGVIISIVKPVAKLYEVIIILFPFIIFFVAKNKHYVILLTCAYVAGSSVFMRMTGGIITNEMHKYIIIVLVVLGILLKDGPTKGYQYLIFILLMITSLLVGEYTLDENIRKYLAFNLAGPVCLAITAFYFYKKTVTYKQLNKALFYFVLPIISMAVYLYLYSPTVLERITGTSSNFNTSGGFGPNQVSTVLGIGIFILLSRLVLTFKFLNLNTIINLVLLSFLTFRGIITFSRGGVLTALIVSVFFIITLYFYSSRKIKFKLVSLIGIIVLLGIGVWTYASIQTSGLIDKRYTNKDAAGRDKRDVSSGRFNIISLELQAFKENPIFGVGVGKVKEYRYNITGVNVATHNELSRILAEHGLVGIIGMIILLTVPFLLRQKDRSNIYFYPCYFIWLLTISHSATRIAAPCFIYALCLINLQYEKKDTVRRKQIS